MRTSQRKERCPEEGNSGARKGKQEAARRNSRRAGGGGEQTSEEQTSGGADRPHHNASDRNGHATGGSAVRMILSGG